MAVPITVEQYQRGNTTYYRYYTPYVGKQYASGSFAAEGRTPAQAREEAARKASGYLNLPLHEFEGYETQAPAGTLVGEATAVREQQAAESRANLASLKAGREQLKAGYSGEFKTEYAQRSAAAPVGTPIPTQQEFMKVQALQTGKAAFASEQEFKKVTEPLSKFGAFAGVTEFKGQVVQPAQPQPLAPSYNYESPFGKGIIKPAGFPGAKGDQLFPASRVGRSETEFRYSSKYGQLFPSDIAAEQAAIVQRRVYSEVTPKGLTLSPFSRSVFKGAVGVSERIRGFTVNTGFLPKEVKESPGMQGGTFVFQKMRESGARLMEFAGSVPGTTEVWGRTAISQPGKLPGMIAVGGLSVVGGIAKQIETEPAQFVSDIAFTTGAFRAMSKARTGITEPLKTIGKKYVPPETIIEPQVLSGAERFPLAKRGTTGAALVKEFNIGKYRLPGTEGKTGGWHATPSEFAKETRTQAGTSESPGLYISPSTSPHFWKIGGGQFKLFGFDNPPESPTGIWMGTAGIKRSPAMIRGNIGKFNAFLSEKRYAGKAYIKSALTGKAQKGAAYISSAFEKGIKPEKEAIIPPETVVKRVRADQYTKYKGKVVPLMEYSAMPEGIVDYGASTFLKKELPGITSWGEQHVISAGKFFPHGRKLAVGGGLVLTASAASAKPKTKKELTFEELSRRQAQLYESYRTYRQPIITPSSLFSSIGRNRYQSSSKVSRRVSSVSPSISKSRIASSSILKPSYSPIRSSITSLKSSTSGFYSGKASYVSRQVYSSKTMTSGRPGYLSKSTYKYTPGKPGMPPKYKPPVYPKMKSSGFGKRPRGKTSFGKFGELSRVATAKQIRKGIFSLSTKPRKRKRR